MAHRDRVLELTRNALALDSTLAPTHALRGFALALGPDPLDLALRDPTLAAAERGVSLDPGHFLGWFALGFLTRWHGPLSRHLEARFRAVELNPDDLFSLRGMGLYYQETGRADTYLRWIERANAEDPKPARRQGIRAWAYWTVDGHAAGKADATTNSPGPCSGTRRTCTTWASPGSRSCRWPSPRARERSDSSARETHPRHEVDESRI